MKSKKTKRALVSSALALVLCFVMLLGTTFAWFTDNASTSVNKVQAGTLKIGLEYATEWNEDGSVKTWSDAKGKTLDFVKATGHEDEAILWEPGCTYKLPELRIVNEGNLALKYKVVISGIKGDAELNKAIDWTITSGTDTYDLSTEQKLAVGENKEFTISGKMKTDAGNTYQGLSISGISITVVATQDTVEYDSTTDQYDKDATIVTTNVDTAAGLKNAFNNTAGAVSLTKDITMTDSDSSHSSSFCVTSIDGDSNLVIDANGQTVTNSTTDSGQFNIMFAIKENANVTFTGDGTFVNPSRADGSGLIYAYGHSVVTVESGTYELEKNGSAVWAVDDAIVYIKGGTFINKNEDNKTEYKQISDLIYATRRAKIYISGGFFDFNMSGARILNLKDDSKTTAKIVVTGGTFVNFDPSSSNPEYEGHSWVAEGYEVVSETHDNDTWYTVVPKT